MEATGRVAVEERTSTGLIVPDEAAIKQDLQLVDPSTISTQAVDSQLEKQADEFVEMLISGDMDDQRKRIAVDQMGANAYDLLKYKNVIFTTSSIKSFQDRITK